jgi:hypothetical protein
LAADSQAHGGSFADGKSQETKKPLEELEKSEQGNQTPKNTIKISPNGSNVQGQDKIHTSEEEGTEPSKDTENHNNGTSSSEAPGPTGTAPGEPIDSADHSSKQSSHQSSSEHHHKEAVSSKQNHGDKAPSTNNEHATKQDDSKPSSGKGIPEHEHHSTAGAPGPTGTAPGEAMEPADSHHTSISNSEQKSSHHEHHAEHEKSHPDNQRQTPSHPKKENHETPSHKHDNISTPSSTGEHHDDQKQGKGIPEHPHHSLAAAPGPTGTAPGEPMENTEAAHKDDTESSSNKSHNSHHGSSSEKSHTKHAASTSTKDTHHHDSSAKSSSSDAPTSGKGVPEHEHHSNAAAPGPTGTAPGEPMGSTESTHPDSHKSSSPKPNEKETKHHTNDSHHGSSSPKPTESGDHASGKGIPEHEHHSNSGAPGATGASPGEAMETPEPTHKGHSKSSSPKPHDKDVKSQAHDSHQHVSSSEKSTESGDHASGKGVPEHEHHSNAGAPGATGTAPGEGIENDAAKEQDHKSSYAEIAGSKQSNHNHAKHDSHHDSSTSDDKHTEHHHKEKSHHEDHKETPAAGKGIPEHPHHSIAAAPGATGTAPGEAIG